MALRIQKLQLKNFRCFTHQTIHLDAPLVVITGPNGSGKTSVLEALHYLCYVRSFRTYIPRDLIDTSGDKTSFFIKATISADQDEHEIQVGFTGKKRVVKLNQRPVQSFQELMSCYRVITMTEDDLGIIKAGPDIRRATLDQALLLLDPATTPLFKSMRSVLEQRNALLAQHTFDKALYDVWTEQLMEHTTTIQTMRVALLAQLEQRMNNILNAMAMPETSVQLKYLPKKIDKNSMMEEERRMRRSLIGAHLDDIAIHLCNQRSRVYASRGQQKLIVLLLKIALAQELTIRGGTGVMLIDDFMTDFDQTMAEKALDILISLGNQLIFTTPLNQVGFVQTVRQRGGYEINLTHRILG